MRIHEASRTLLKSPPELWAECSDAASLSRHLDQFGEIKITRLEPETAVAWEGAHVSGTVRLEPSGWGTRVILTAEEAEIPDLGPPTEPGASEPATVERTELAGAAVAGAAAAPLASTGSPEAEAAPVVDESGIVDEPAVVDELAAVDEPAVVATSLEPAAMPASRNPARPVPRKGVFARFFARMRPPVPEPDVPPSIARRTPGPKPESSVVAGPKTTVEHDSAVGPEKTVEPDPNVEPHPTVEPESTVELESSVTPEVSVAPEPRVEQPVAEVPPEFNQRAAAPVRATESALKDALESLGSAHHRPFSRS